MKEEVELTKRQLTSIKKREKEIKEGRTYLFCCGSKKGDRKHRCAKSGHELTICFDCHVENCKRWYKIGLKDGRKK